MSSTLEASATPVDGQEEFVFGNLGEDGSGSDNQSGPRRGRPPLVDLLQSRGPNTLVILLGASRGRWRQELIHGAPACRTARAAVDIAVSVEAPADVATVQVVGVAVLQAWHFVHEGQPSSQDTYHLMAAATAAHRKRRQPHFLEHPVIASARLEGSVLMAPGLSCHADHPSLVLAPPSLVLSLSTRQVRVTRGVIPEHPVMSVGGLFNMWSLEYGTALQPIPWAMWTPLAIAVARGVWFGDVTPLYRRDHRRAIMPPIHPSRAQLRKFMGGPASAPRQGQDPS